MFSQTF